MGTRGALVLAAAAATAPAQLLTTDAGVVSPAVAYVKDRVSWTVSEHAEELRSTRTVSWSPERHLQFWLDLPVVVRDVDTVVGGSRAHGTQQGLGDLELGAKYAVLRRDDVMRSDRFSLFANALLPTADQDTDLDGIDLGPRAGLGLGAAGGALGCGYTLVRDRHRAAAALRGHAFATADGFAPGESVSLDLAYWYRLSPATFQPGTHPTEWRTTFELLGRWRDDDRLRGGSLDNGGHTWSAVVGVQANMSAAISCEFGVAVPLVDTTTSVFGDQQYSFLFAFRWYF